MGGFRINKGKLTSCLAFSLLLNLISIFWISSLTPSRANGVQPPVNFAVINSDWGTIPYEAGSNQKSSLYVVIPMVSGVENYRLFVTSSGETVEILTNSLTLVQSPSLQDWYDANGNQVPNVITNRYILESLPAGIEYNFELQSIDPLGIQDSAKIVRISSGNILGPVITRIRPRIDSLDQSLSNPGDEVVVSGSNLDWINRDQDGNEDGIQLSTCVEYCGENPADDPRLAYIDIPLADFVEQTPTSIKFNLPNQLPVGTSLGAIWEVIPKAWGARGSLTLTIGSSVAETFEPIPKEAKPLNLSILTPLDNGPRRLTLIFDDPTNANHNNWYGIKIHNITDPNVGDINIPIISGGQIPNNHWRIYLDGLNPGSQYEISIRSLARDAGYLNSDFAVISGNTLEAPSIVTTSGAEISVASEVEYILSGNNLASLSRNSLEKILLTCATCLGQEFDDFGGNYFEIYNGDINFNMEDETISFYVSLDVFSDGAEIFLDHELGINLVYGGNSSDDNLIIASGKFVKFTADIVLSDPITTHTISVNSGPNGSISPSTSTAISDAATPSYTITPASGFIIDTATVDSVEINSDLVTVSGSSKSYTFASVTADHTIAATFKAQVASVIALSHSVFFFANGGSGTMNVETSTVTAALTQNAFTKTGYTFAGWANSTDGTVFFADKAPYDFTSDINLYAKWALNLPPSIDRISPTPVVYIPPPPQPYLTMSISPTIHGNSETAVCSAGEYDYGIVYFDGTPNSILKNVPFDSHTYRFFIDGVEKKELTSTSNLKIKSISLSFLHLAGLLTCQIEVGRGSVSITSNTTQNTQGVSEAASVLKAGIEAATLEFQNKLSINSESKKAELDKNRKIWRDLVDQAKAVFIASKLAARNSKELVQASKLQSLSISNAAKAYKSGINEIGNEYIKKNGLALSNFNRESEYLKSVYTDKLELVGYGVTLKK